MKEASQRKKKEPMSNLAKNFPDLIANSNVVCIICGINLRLSELILHQKLAHENLSSDPVTECIFCKVPLFKKSMERHMRRKHPAEMEGTKWSVFQDFSGKSIVTNTMEYAMSATQQIDAIQRMDVACQGKNETVTELSLEQDEEFIDLVFTTRTKTE